jgi:hypothetical protein
VGAGERGWDVFSLSYDVREPLSTVLTPANMLSYKRVFKLLWDVKHVEHSLSAAWHIMKPNMRLFTTEHLNGPAGTLTTHPPPSHKKTHARFGGLRNQQTHKRTHTL